MSPRKPAWQRKRSDTRRMLGRLRDVLKDSTLDPTQVYHAVDNELIWVETPQGHDRWSIAAYHVRFHNDPMARLELLVMVQELEDSL
jgi:hypothetical protein